MTPIRSWKLSPSVGSLRLFRPRSTETPSGNATTHSIVNAILVERFFNLLKHFRAIATRYDKLARNFLAGVQLAAVTILPDGKVRIPGIERRDPHGIGGRLIPNSHGLLRSNYLGYAIAVITLFVAVAARRCLHFSRGNAMAGKAQTKKPKGDLADRYQKIGIRAVAATVRRESTPNLDEQEQTREGELELKEL